MYCMYAKLKKIILTKEETSVFEGKMDRIINKEFTIVMVYKID